MNILKKTFKRSEWAVVVILFFASACNNDEVNTNNIALSLQYFPVEKQLLEGEPANLNKRIAVAQKTYPEFLNLYSLQILRIGNPADENYQENLSAFLQYCHKLKLLKEVAEKFPDFSSYKNKIEEAFKRFHYYFPKKQTPDLYTFVSAFNESIVTDSLILGVALDKYLGENNPFYAQLQWDLYLRKRMIPEMIPPDALRAWGTMEFPMKTEKENMLAYMIYEGKIQYFLDKMFPEMADSIKWSYTEEQWSWVNRHEKKIWTYMVESKTLFETSTIEINKYVRNAPFTSAFSSISAPRVGVWIGYKIIDAYMKNNPNVSFPELMEEQNAQKILDLSAYRP